MRPFITALLAVTLIGACTEPSPDPVSLDVLQEQKNLPDNVGTDAVAHSDAEADEMLPGELLRTIDIMEPEALLECQPGDGCFLDQCQDNGDCNSGWCVEHMGESVCTKTCQEDCPAGWSCRLLSDTGSDLIYICVSDHASLCKPCAASADCNAVGDADHVCLDYGDEGNFCGGPCATGEDCPWGFACKEATTVDGVELAQCVAEAGVCPCTDKSIAAGLFTTCELTSEFGTCQGKRVCTHEGLGDCDSQTPAAEECNGLDDDCDGLADNPNLIDGEFVNLCDDENPCTLDQCKGDEGCTNEELSEGECVDGDACTMGDHCESGVCLGLPIDCDDGNPCTDDSCDGLGGCKAEFNAEFCDDSDPCTVGDWCQQGTCTGFAVDCQCQTDDDCLQLDDGNLCNGTLFCDTSTLPYQCAVDSETVVECPALDDPAQFCNMNVCDPETGTCSVVPDHQGFACDDLDSCTVGDKCWEGQCVPGVGLGCNDGNTCTSDSCEPDSGCVFQPVDSPCNDGDVCTEQDVCVDGSCEGGPAINCNDENNCTDDSCDPEKGCVHIFNFGECDDGDVCTTGDHCANGSCKPLGFDDCDDKNPCTSEVCISDMGGCLYEFTSDPCDDGDPCTLNDMCANGLCQSGPAAACGDSNPCTDDSCNEDGICIYSANNAPCDDNNQCTSGDHCAGGQCLFGEMLDCDDDDVCTDDSCLPGNGCIHTLNQAPCNDDDQCTSGDHCHLGSCIPSAQIACDDSNPCTEDSCDSKSGCLFIPNQMACDDGNQCTETDLCSGGQCLGQAPLDCDDENQCTVDYCDFATGCGHVNTDGECNDGNLCTVDSFCQAGQCTGGTPFTCDDQNLCTDASCDPETGCHFVPNQVPCDDLNACTDQDACFEAACKPGQALVCDDAEPCTEDSCNPDSGCTFTPVPDDTECGLEMHCVAGVCLDDCSGANGSQVLSHTGGMQQFVVPECVDTVTIEAWGGQGGKNSDCSQTGGKGARMKGTFSVTPGETLKVVAGGRGKDYASNSANYTGSGAGGSFVWRDGGTQLLIAAGGGGGGAICTSGGDAAHAWGVDAVTGESGTADSRNIHPGGSNGADGGGPAKGKGWNNVKSNPAGYGSGNTQGGYGGGGTPVDHSGAGGGGYSGGAGAKWPSGYPSASGGGGGGSYNAGTNKDNTPGANTGHGKVVISW